jgi:3',5'-cyclic AMP phosphodiesterase CpdA
VRIVCVSDTHLRTADLAVPDGDLLLHAGDLTGVGDEEEVGAVARWLASLPHRRKVVIAGNHDRLLQRQPARARALFAAVPGLVYLEDAEARIEGLRIWGSPWQPALRGWAFGLRRGEPLRRRWERIPEGIDVLLTHGPPAGILDEVVDGHGVGCADLLDAVRRVRPRLHVFGHIHQAAGQAHREGVHFVNAATVDLAYEPVNPPIVLDVDTPG